MNSGKRSDGKCHLLTETLPHLFNLLTFSFLILLDGVFKDTSEPDILSEVQTQKAKTLVEVSLNASIFFKHVK